MKMSSTKTSKSSKLTSKEDKDIVVSFASDSDDDDNSSAAPSDNSDSEGIKDDKSPAASSATAAIVASVKQKATKQVESGLDDEEKSSCQPSSAADQQPSLKQVTPPSDEEKPARKSVKSKSKDPSKSTPLVTENGSTVASAEKVNKSTGSESKSDEPKIVKKKKTVKADLNTVNGESQQVDATGEVKYRPTENNEPNEVDDKKKPGKTTKKPSKAVEKIENIGLDSITTDKKGKSLDETTDFVAVKDQSQPATVVDTDDPTAKPLKKAKRSAKTSSAVTVNGECDKTKPVEEAAEKASEKKLLKKSKETVEDSNSATVGTAAKVDKEDAVKKEANEKSTTDNIPQQCDEVTSRQTDSKVKIKKKKEKMGDTKIENDQSMEAETSALASEEVTADSKIVKKKKVKKVASSDVPTDSLACSSTPIVTAEPTDTIEKLDLDADREVQSICERQPDVESTEHEVPLIAIESKPTEFSSAPTVIAISEDSEIKLPRSVSSSDDLKLSAKSVSPGSHADNTGSDVSPLKERTDDCGVECSPSVTYETTTTESKNENMDYLTVAENKASAADVSKEDSRSRDNEESDYTYRRKSMDDFIKRILAEAREEQQKKISATQYANEAGSSSLTTSAEVNNESEQSPLKSKDDQEILSTVRTGKDDPVLGRELASTDRKSFQTGLDDIGVSNKNVSSADVDLDDDLAQIKGYFSRRGQASLRKLEPMNDIINGLSGTDRSRSALAGVGDGDDISIAQKVLKDVLPEDSGTFLSRLRQTERNDNIADDDYAPKRREETTEVVRSSTKPVRAVIDQQTEVIQQLKTTSRSIDELENEIRALRETFLDRQARIDSLRSAIDAESRIYEAEQVTANDRIQQQKLPGGRFVRDEFMASFTPRLFPGETSLRSRSGSISGTVGLAVGSLPVGSGVNEPNSMARATSLKPASDTQRFQLGDVDDSLSTTSGYSSGRFRRGGSVARERTYTIDEMLGGSGGYGTSSSASRTSGLSSADVLAPSTFNNSWSSYTTSASPDVTRQFQPGSSYSSSYTRRFQTDSNDYRSPSSYSSTPAYDSGRTSSQYVSGLRLDRSYVRDSTSPGSSVSTNYSLTSGSYIDPSRFRRAQSVIDVSSNYDSGTSFVSTPGSTGGGEFQSRFLDKVRGKKAFDDSRSGSGQFKSRFLRSNFDSSSKY